MTRRIQVFMSWLYPMMAFSGLLLACWGLVSGSEELNGGKEVSAMASLRLSSHMTESTSR
jgi:hypothetical protein